MVKVLIGQKGHRNLAQTYPLFYTLSHLKYTGIGFMKWTSRVEESSDDCKAKNVNYEFLQFYTS